MDITDEQWAVVEPLIRRRSLASPSIFSKESSLLIYGAVFCCLYSVLGKVWVQSVTDRGR